MPGRISISWDSLWATGCVVRHARTTRLVITLVGVYPEIIGEAAAAVQLAGLRQRASVLRSRARTRSWSKSHSTHWPVAFPQHGPGRKHTRPIVLADRQREIVDRDPRQLLRGLIHSDDCRTVNRFTEAAERAPRRVRVSALLLLEPVGDIRGLFCEYCERLGIRWTQSNHRNISVAHRRSVAVLDKLVPGSANGAR